MIDFTKVNIVLSPSVFLIFTVVYILIYMSKVLNILFRILGFILCNIITVFLCLFQHTVELL